MVVGVIDCVTVGRGVDVENGVLVLIIEFIAGSGDNKVVKPGFGSDVPEQLANTMNINNENNRFMKTLV